MKKFSKFTQIDEISTGKLTDYVAKASMDVGRRIEKAEPGVKPMKKILDRSGKIGRAKAHIQIKANESVDMCNVCGQTPCNCTSIDEGTVQDKIDKAAKIYNAHRSLADQARKVGLGKKRDPEAEAHHMKKSHKAFDLMQKLRAGSSEANKSNPKPRPKEVDYGAAIAQDYKDQEARRGIGHVRDSVEMDDTKSIIELKDTTLKSYIRQSSGDVSHKQNVANRFGMTNKVRAVIKKRNAGQAVAQRKLGEDVEQVDELNISTVKSYLKKAKKAEVTHDANATKLLRASKKAFYKKDAEELYAKAADQQGRSSSRSRGIPMAQARLAKEDIEQVDELKNTTLGSYIKKAAWQHTTLRADLDSPQKKMTTDKILRKMANRRKGVNDAVNRITKEEVERVDELKKSTLASYVDKSTQDDGDSRGRTVKAGREQGVTKAAYRTQGLAHKKGTDGFRKYRAEEVEQVDELKVGTLLRYNTKAIKSSTKHGGEAGRAIDAGDRETAAKHFAKRDSRDAGARRALAKILAKKKTV